MKRENILHSMINKVREEHNLKPLEWDQAIYYDCKRQAVKMAKQGRVFHSILTENQSGECCAGRIGRNTKATLTYLLKGWMNSPDHRDLILFSNAKHAAVAIATSRKGTYASWAFSRN